MADGEEIGAILGYAMAAALAVMAAFVALMALATVGSLFGSGVAVQNYIQAFRAHVKPERLGV